MDESTRYGSESAGRFCLFIPAWKRVQSLHSLHAAHGPRSLPPFLPLLPRLSKALDLPLLSSAFGIPNDPSELSKHHLFHQYPFLGALLRVLDSNPHHTLRSSPPPHGSTTTPLLAHRFLSPRRCRPSTPTTKPQTHPTTLAVAEHPDYRSRIRTNSSEMQGKTKRPL